MFHCRSSSLETMTGMCWSRGSLETCHPVPGLPYPWRKADTSCPACIDILPQDWAVRSSDPCTRSERCTGSAGHMAAGTDGSAPGYCGQWRQVPRVVGVRRMALHEPSGDWTVHSDWRERPEIQTELTAIPVASPEEEGVSEHRSPCLSCLRRRLVWHRGGWIVV